MDAPERIWVGEDLIEHDAEGAHVTADPEATHVEYVRADALAAKDAEIERLRAENERLRKLDSESATHVESVICLRTEFTGDPPYVGWKGLGLALTEALNERDRLRARIAEKDEVLGEIRAAVADGHSTRLWGVDVEPEAMSVIDDMVGQLNVVRKIARKALEG